MRKEQAKQYKLFLYSPLEESVVAIRTTEIKAIRVAWQETSRVTSAKSVNIAKCCNSSKQRVNLVREEKLPSLALDCNLIEIKDDSEPEYGVFQLEDTVRINNIELLKSAVGKPRSLSFQLRSGFSFFIPLSIPEARFRSSTNVR